MAVGRVNVSGLNIEDLNIFEISEITTQTLSTGNVLSDLGISYATHEIYNRRKHTDTHLKLVQHSWGRDGNILLIKPKVKGERWIIAQYNFEKGKFEIVKTTNVQQPTNDPIEGLSVEIKGDMNLIKIVYDGISSNEVSLGKYSTSKNPGNWVSENLAVKINDVVHEITFYNKSGKEIDKDFLDWYDDHSFIFISPKERVVGTRYDRQALTDIIIFDPNTIKQIARRTFPDRKFRSYDDALIYDHMRGVFYQINTLGSYNCYRWHREKIDLK